MKNLTELKNKIEKELSPLYPKIAVAIVKNWETVTEIHCENLPSENIYPGMKIDHISVHYNYDGFHYLESRYFSFDANTLKLRGNKKEERSIQKAVEDFIEDMKYEYTIKYTYFSKKENRTMKFTNIRTARKHAANEPCETVEIRAKDGSLHEFVNNK